MGSKPTFHLADDYVALMDLKPAERTVYMLLRCNASFGREGVADHVVHVTAAWFTEMTSHWEKPLPASTARRGLNGLIDKGVLIRLNEPQDGSGFVVAFVADPRGRVEGPVNGFAHAKKVAKRCGLRAYYERLDDVPGMPAVTGVRLSSPKGRWPKRAASMAPEVEADEPAVENAEEFRPDDAALAEQVNDVFNAVEAEGDTSDEDAATDVEAPPLTAEMEALAEALERRTSRLNVIGHRLTRDQCRAVARECGPALALGWDPAVLAQNMVAQMGPKIHSPLRFLPKKASELGAPPPAKHAVPAPIRTEPVVDVAPAPTPEDVAKGAGGLGMQKLQQFLVSRQRVKDANGG